MAVTDWLAEGLPGRAAKTVEVYRDALRPVLAVAGRIPLRDLTVQDVRTALAKMAVTHSTPTLQKAHNCLTRALRHAEGQDLIRRNVSALVDTPHGREGPPGTHVIVCQCRRPVHRIYRGPEAIRVKAKSRVRDRRRNRARSTHTLPSIGAASARPPGTAGGSRNGQ